MALASFQRGNGCLARIDSHKATTKEISSAVDVHSTPLLFLNSRMDMPYLFLNSHLRCLMFLKPHESEMRLIG